MIHICDSLICNFLWGCPFRISASTSNLSQGWLLTSSDKCKPGTWEQSEGIALARKLKMNSKSGLLTPLENQKVQDIINPDSSRHKQILTTAVARIYLTAQHSRHLEWEPLTTGVACMVKDFDRRSYYITVSKMICVKMKLARSLRYKVSPPT